MNTRLTSVLLALLVLGALPAPGQFLSVFDSDESAFPIGKAVSRESGTIPRFEGMMEYKPAVTNGLGTGVSGSQGRGEADLFDTELPEGRLYTRTVKVIIETPVRTDADDSPPQGRNICRKQHEPPPLTGRNLCKNRRGFPPACALA